MGELSRAPVERLLKRAGAKRISGRAKDLVIQVLENYAIRISEEAARICREDGRKVLKARDVDEALRRLSCHLDDVVQEKADELSLSPVRRLMRSAGALRVSRLAVELLKREIEAYALQVTRNAISLRRYGGQKIKGVDILEAAKVGGILLESGRLKVLIKVSGNWVPAGRELLESAEIQITGLNDGDKVRMWHVYRGRHRTVFSGIVRGDAIIFRLPNLPKRIHRQGDVIYSLSADGVVETFLLLPRGYSEGALSSLIRIAIDTEFGGLERELGTISLPNGYYERLHARAQEISKEYGNIVAFHLIRREVTDYLRR